MYVLVAGASGLGRHLARLVRAEGHDVVVVEREEGALERAQSLDALTVAGNPASPRVLERAEIARADYLFALTDDDEVNLMACALARTRGVRTVCRLDSVEYMDAPVTTAYRVVGAEVAVSVDMLSAIKVARVLAWWGVQSLDVFAEGRLQIAAHVVAESSPLVGKALAELRLPEGARAVAFVREDELFLPESGYSLAPGDRVHLALRTDVSSSALARALRPDVAEVPGAPRNVLIAGATGTGLYLARLLQAAGATVRIADPDRSRVRRASEEVTDVLVVHGSATDRQFLEEEGIETVDAVAAVSSSEEFNILAALIARQLRVPRVVALVDQPELTSLAEAMGLDAAPSGRLDAVGAIYRYVHPLAPDDLLLLARGEAQYVEVTVRPGARVEGIAIPKLSLPGDASLVAVVRGGSCLFRAQAGTIEAGDRLVLLVRNASVRALARLLAGGTP